MKIQTRAALAVYVLDLPATWELLRSKLKRNIRESIRHCYNSLQREHLSFQISTARLPGEVGPALTRFFELHTARALDTQGVSHPTISKTTRREVSCTSSANALYYSGYDPRWSKYSVMTTTVTEIVKSAITEGLDSINFSTGKDVSKTRWGTREMLLEEVVQISPSLFSRLAWIAYRSATSGETMPDWMAWLTRRLKRQWS